MRKKTRNSAQQLRGIAVFILALGLAMSIFFLMISLSVMTNTAEPNQNLRMFLASVFGAYPGPLGIIAALRVSLIAYVVFAFISGFATIVENSDRSEVADALYEISEAITGEEKEPRHRNLERAVEAAIDEIDGNE